MSKLTSHPDLAGQRQRQRQRCWRWRWQLAPEVPPGADGARSPAVSFACDAAAFPPAGIQGSARKASDDMSSQRVQQPGECVFQ